MEETVNGINWLTVDQDDPGFGLLQEDELEADFFGESPGSDEDESDTEDYNGNEHVSGEDKQNANENPEVVPVSNEEALSDFP